MGENKKAAAAKRKAKRDRDKRVKGKDGLGSLFKRGYYLLNQKRNNDG